MQIAKRLGPGKTVVTVLPDSATRYTTKFLNDQWMKDYGFFSGDRDLGLVEDILKAMPKRPILTAAANTPVSQIIETFRERGVSQLPILDERKNPVSMVHEVDLLRGLQSGQITGSSPASAVANPIGGLIYPKARIEELFRIFETDQVGVVVDNNVIVGIVSKIDVLDFMSNRKH